MKHLGLVGLVYSLPTITEFSFHLSTDSRFPSLMERLGLELDGFTYSEHSLDQRLSGHTSQGGHDSSEDDHAYGSHNQAVSKGDLVGGSSLYYQHKVGGERYLFLVLVTSLYL
jgi:hypothetical protein